MLEVISALQSSASWQWLATEWKRKWPTGLEIQTLGWMFAVNQPHFHSEKIIRISYMTTGSPFGLFQTYSEKVNKLDLLGEWQQRYVAWKMNIKTNLKWKAWTDIAQEMQIVAEVYAKMLNITQKRNVHSMTSFPVANRQRCPRRTTHCPEQALRKHAHTLSRQLHWLIKIRNCNVAFDPEIPFLGIYNTDTSVPHKLTTAWGFSVYTVFMAKDWTHCNLQKWYWWTHPQDRNRDADVENGSVDTARKEKVLPRE